MRRKFIPLGLFAGNKLAAFPLSGSISGKSGPPRGIETLINNRPGIVTADYTNVKLNDKYKSFYETIYSGDIWMSVR